MSDPILDNPDHPYWSAVARKAAELKSDGCTFAAEMFVPCCQEHDIHWRTGKRLDGMSITKHEANVRFFQCQQARSKLGKFSPVPYYRFACVSVNAARLALASKIKGWFR